MEKDRYFGISKRIAKWKECNDFEEKLGEFAEISLEGRRLYAEYYRQLDKDYYENGKSFAHKLINSNKDFSNDDSIEDIYVDMVYCLHRYGLSFLDYVSYGLKDKSENLRKMFVSDKLRYFYCDILNTSSVKDIMTNKFKCYEKFQTFYKRNVVSLISQNDKDSFLKFVKSHHKGIFKPLTDHSGHGISLINFDEINPNEWFDKTIEMSPGVLEELIIQGNQLNELNPASVNTCRVVTFRINDRVIIFAATLRMGTGNSIMDNAGTGGIYASVDPETGIVQSDAINLDNQHFLIHPLTKHQIIGFKLPKWEEAKELVTSMALHLSGATLISWDIAYSNKGWCMVEANENGAWRIIQSNLKKGKKQELYSLMDNFFMSIDQQ